MTGTATFSKTGAPLVANAARTSLNVVYDAPSKGYTIETGGRSRTFLPGDIDASKSSAGAVVYIKTSGTTTDSLTLTRPGTSGRLTYQYVGAGFWQRTIDGASAVNGSFDAFTYGFPTADAVVPRSGRAEYGVDLLGVEALGSEALGLAGSGTMQVDFLTGNVLVHGALDPATSSDGRAGSFSSESKLSTGANAFAGNFRLDDFGTFRGTLNGRFYGPATQEVGAVFAATEPGGRAVAGTLTGRGGPVTAVNTSVVSPTVNEFFANDAGSLRASLTGSSGTNASGATFSGRSQSQASLVVNYDATRHSYTLIAPDRSYYTEDTAPRGTVRESFQGSNPGNVNERLPPDPVLDALRYVRTGRWFRSTGNSPNTDYLIDEISFGVVTANGALPRTGSAGFVIGMIGTAADSDFPNLLRIFGYGTLSANFGTGAIDLSGSIRYHEDFTMSGRAAAEGTGSFNGSASLSSSANAFAGNLSFTGFGNYSGPLSGRFYGPAAEEVGAAFSASDGAGGVAAGAFVGGRDASVLTASKGLLDLTDPTTFDFVGWYGRKGDDVQQSQRSTLNYDPATKAYSFTAVPGRNGTALTTAFGQANIVAADTGATYTSYANPGATLGVSAKLFNPGPGNPKMALTYLSFADIVVDETDPFQVYSTRHLAFFGLRTSTALLPRSGTATYTGFAYGYGKTTAFGSEQPIEGTSNFAANFGSSTFDTTINVHYSNGNPTTIRPFIYSGTIDAGGAFAGNIDRSPSDILSGFVGGAFYGPQAAELGHLFTATITADVQRTFYGVVVGKKN